MAFIKNKLRNRLTCHLDMCNCILCIKILHDQKLPFLKRPSNNEKTWIHDIVWIVKGQWFLFWSKAFSLLNPFFDRAIFFVYQPPTYVMNCMDDCMYNILSFFFFVETHIAQAGHCFYFGGMTWKLQEGVLVNYGV
jgi:hypothetical protein